MATLLVTGASLPAGSAAMHPPTKEEQAALPLWLAKEGVLSPANHPRLIHRADMERGRRNVARYRWAREFLESRQAICQRFVSMSDEALRALVPKPGSLFVMGLGMNLDPVHGSRMRWAGWERPFSVVDIHGTLYPNAEWPDDGTGALDPKSKKRFLFVALANASIVNALEREILPALADVYALSESLPHAHAAAVLLDALASSYPGSIRGPLDYPMGKELRRYGGRLDRPTQQVARGVASYAHVIDLIAASGELEKPSASGGPMRLNIARNLLWDGASYCLLFCRQLNDLGNGMADFNYGAAVAGLLLDEPEFCKPLTVEAKSIYAMLRQNLTRQAFYFEASPGYEFFTLNLYARSAELIEALRETGLSATPSLFEHPGALRLFTAPFQQREVGGHIPLLGNTRVDVERVDAGSGLPGSGDGTQNRFRGDQLLSSAMVATRSSGAAAQTARAWLQTITGSAGLEPFADQWFVYHYQPENFVTTTAAPEPKATFDGGKGIALLRGGAGAATHGAQLFFGPSQVKSQNEALSWTFFHQGAEWSFDPGRFNAHFRFGWCASSVAHQSMVVDRANVDLASGAGHLLSFGEIPDRQWALGSHPGAYREQGVTRFERFLAQVQEKAGGELLYWLDVGRIKGGTRREESFHTQMRQVAADIPWKEAGEALFGEKDLGQAIQNDYSLRGSTEGFYWVAPGEGYGFLGKPRVAPRSGALRTVWSDPAFFNDKSARLMVDFPGETQEIHDAAPGVKREWILAQGPKAPGHPSVPYLLRSDVSAGEKASLFAKILHFAPADGGAPRVTGVQRVPVATDEPGDGLAGAWLIQRRDGCRDLWILNDKEGRALHVKPAGLPPVETDALVAWVQYDREGKATRLLGDAASRLCVDGGPQLTGQAALEGTVEEIGDGEAGVALRVRWETPLPHDQIATGYGGLAQIHPPVGQPSTWSVRQISERQLLLDDASTSLGGGSAIRRDDGWIEFPFSISRFTVGQTGNTRFAEGKALYSAGKMVGRIVAISDDCRAIKADRPLPPAALGDLEIREAAAGDKVTVPLRLMWKESPPASTME